MPEREPKQKKPASLVAQVIKEFRADWRYRPPQAEPPPATEKTFKEVWQVWNLCPAQWATDLRVRELGCSKRSFADRHHFYSNQRKRLMRRRHDRRIEISSAEFLKAWTRPFGKRHRAALRHAEWWHNFAREHYPIVATRKSKRVKLWLCFQDDNLSHSDDDVATWRTGRELIAQKEFKGVSLAKFWELKEPTLGLVEHAQRRWRAYRDARTKARQHFRKLDVPGKLSDYASPADALWRMEHGFWNGDEARMLANKLNDAEKEMVRNPDKLLEFVGDKLKTAQNIEDVLRRTHRTTPKFLDQWGFMFRCACGLVSQDELRLTSG